MELIKTLVIIAHPDIDTSRVNKRWTHFFYSRRNFSSFESKCQPRGAVVSPYVSVFGASFQASDEEIDLSAQQYLESILKEI